MKIKTLIQISAIVTIYSCGQILSVVHAEQVNWIQLAASSATVNKSRLPSASAANKSVQQKQTSKDSRRKPSSMKRRGVKVNPSQWPTAGTSNSGSVAYLTPHECKGLGGKPEYHKGCDGTLLKCTVVTSDGKVHAVCITEKEIYIEK